MNKPYGYEECYKAIKDAILDTPRHYEPFSTYFDTYKLEKIKEMFGKYLFDLCLKDVELYELPVSASENPIKTLRGRMGLSRSGFAKYLQIPIGTLQGWEQGRRKPPEYIINIIERLIKAENPNGKGRNKE